MLSEGRGTCSTKHLFLAQAIAKRFPETEPRIVHRVYRLNRNDAQLLFGDTAASAVPPEGLVDVHRYLTLCIDGHRIVVDATFPGPPWDGISSLPLSCGSGRDYLAGADPDAEKRALEATYCDHSKREPFIQALTAATLSNGSSRSGV